MIAIIASGPSLHLDDVAEVQRAGLYTIAVNSSWRYAPFADVIFAGDCSWWDQNARDIDIKAERWACTDIAKVYGTHKFDGMGGWNSGANAILFAIREKKAASILLLGFDCCVANGTHIHGDHLNNKNPTAGDTLRWRKEFQQVAGIAKEAGVQVINCSRYTALESFPRLLLEQVLYGRRPRIPADGD